MMYHLHYDSPTGRILGFYVKGVSNYIPAPTIQIDESIKSEICNKTHRFKVVNRQLVESEGFGLVTKVRKDVGEFVFDDAVFVADRMFLSNLSINLSISCANSNHTCKFWCLVDSEFTTRTLDASKIMSLAEAYEKARSELMEE